MKYQIPFVALGLLTFACAASQAQDTVTGDVSIAANAPAATYTAGPAGTAPVSGQSSHSITYTNTGQAAYMLLLSYSLSFNLGGQSASAGGVVGESIPPGLPWRLMPNPTMLNAQGVFAIGVYSTEAHTELFTTGNGLKTNGNPIAKRNFSVTGPKVAGGNLLLLANVESLIGFVTD